MIDKTNYTIALNDFLRKCVSLYAEYAEAHGLSYYELLTLYILNRQERITQKDVGIMFCIPKQSVSRVAQSLISKSLIEFRPSETDRREKVFTLTETGKEFVKESIVPLIQIEEEIFDKIGSERVKQSIDEANSLLQQMRGGMKSATDKFKAR